MFIVIAFAVRVGTPNGFPQEHSELLLENIEALADYEGRPVARFKFDRKLSMMAVSPKYNKIYALDNQVDNELYVYDLPQLN